jgi:hypothetical protein
MRIYSGTALVAPIPALAPRFSLTPSVPYFTPLSLAPGFNRVSREPRDSPNRFNGFSSPTARG